MLIRSIALQNFRCFEQLNVVVTAPILVIEGLNGAGKTSLLEALHYACYLRSFRATTPRDMIKFNEPNFFIKLKFELMDQEYTGMHELSIGVGQDKKRIVKLNGKAIRAYKELMEHYRVITLTEDDMSLVKDGPEQRRLFVDQAISLYQPSYMESLRIYKEILANRNALLANSHVPKDMYYIWTEQLWQLSQEIGQQRKSFLHHLELEVAQMLKAHFPEDIRISFTHVSRGVSSEDGEQTFDQFMQENASLYQKELVMGRSLFGSHLDDVRITFAGKGARSFASRGQQKLVVLLIKLAQLQALSRQKGPAILLLDDFLTDFDQERITMALNTLMTLNCQLIFTAPIQTSLLWDLLSSRGAQLISFQSE